MLFHAKPAVTADVVVVKEGEAAGKSEVAKRDASPSPSRPEFAPVLRTKLELIPDTGVENAVTPEETLPLCDESTAPKSTLPITEIRTGGLG